MRRERPNLEEQVGGLIDHGGRRARRRAIADAVGPEPAEPQRYDLTRPSTVAIRAARASGDDGERQVA